MWGRSSGSKFHFTTQQIPSTTPNLILITEEVMRFVEVHEGCPGFPCMPAAMPKRQRSDLTAHRAHRHSSGMAADLGCGLHLHICPTCRTWAPSLSQAPILHMCLRTVVRSNTIVRTDSLAIVGLWAYGYGLVPSLAYHRHLGLAALRNAEY